jgi:hypothetical protein
MKAISSVYAACAPHFLIAVNYWRTVFQKLEKASVLLWKEAAYVMVVLSKNKCTTNMFTIVLEEVRTN